MPKSGIMRARKYRRYRKHLSLFSQARASEISSRGIALTDVDLAMVIGGTHERSDARAQMEVGTAQPLGCCCDGMQANASARPYGKRIFL